MYRVSIISPNQSLYISELPKVSRILFASVCPFRRLYSFLILSTRTGCLCPMRMRDNRFNICLRTRT